MANFFSIPPEMREFRQWVCWRTATNKAIMQGSKLGRNIKIPIDPLTGAAASVNDMSTWGSWQQAIDAITMSNGRGDLGLGFVLTENDPFCFIDFDDPYKRVKSSNDHALADIHLQKQIAWHNKINSYSEVSPSGKGLHIIVQGKIPYSKRCESIEIYDSGRFMTMTGNVYNSISTQARQSELLALWNDLGETREEVVDLSQFSGSPQLYSDDDILRIAGNAANGQKFVGLFNGDIETWHCGDHSSADFALIDILAFYTQNVEQIVRLFRSSALGSREKAKRDDYVFTMVRKSFDKIVPGGVNVPVEIDLSSIANELESVTKGIVPSALHVASEMDIQPVVARVASMREKIENVGSKYSSDGLEIPQDVMISLDELQIPPGVTGQIADFIYRSAWKPVPQVALIGGIGLMAGLIGRNFNVFGKGLNLYLLLLAKTGRGKDAISDGHARLFDACKQLMPQIMDFKGPGDIASGQGLLRYLSDSRTKSACAVFGEFGPILKRITNSKAMASDLMTQKVLLDIYSKSGRTGIIEPTMYSDAERNTNPIQSPAFTLVGESVPKWIDDNLGFGMISSGLLPRFVILEYLGERVPSNYGASMVIPSNELVTSLCSLTHQSLTYANQNFFYDIPFDSVTEELSKRLDRFCDLRINLAPNDSSGEIWNRVHLNTAKIAAILAVGINWIKPIITVDCWEWAEKFVMYSALHLERKFDSGDVIIGDDPGAYCRCVERLFVEFVTTAADQVGVDGRLHSFKAIPYRWLSAKVHTISMFKQHPQGPISVLKSSLSQLIDGGDIIEIPKTQAIKDFGTHGRLFVPRPEMIKRLTSKASRLGL